MSRREGKIEKRNGRHYASVERSRDPLTGARRRWSLGGFDTRDEAARAIRKSLDRLDRGLVDPGKLTVGSYLVETWLPGVELELAPTTFALYRTMVTIYIVPHIGSEPLRGVNPAMLTRLYRDLLAGGGRGGRGLAPRTGRNAHRTIRTALESAVEARLIDWNPAAAGATKVPRLPRTELEVWTLQQLGRFLEQAAHDRLSALWIVASVTGMRRGELCGLRWTDVDLDGAQIRIRRTLTQYGTEVFEKEPKSGRSRRTYADVDQRAIAALRAHRARQKAERLAAGPAYERTDRVFTDELGADLRPGAVTKGMARIVKAAGLPHLSPHGLRHSFATIGLESGVDVVYVSELLGHASPAITMSTYQHRRPERLSEASRTISSAILGA